mgnify:CR=1 FL=1
MINMIHNIHRSPDVPDMGAAPPPEMDQTPATEPATSPDMSQYVSKQDFEQLQNNYNRAEGRVKSSQKLLSLAQQMGYSDADSFADALPGMMSSRQQQTQPQTFAGQYPDVQQEDHRPTHRNDGPSLDDIDQRITQRLGYQQSMNTHELGRDAESKLITSIIGGEGAFGGVFDGVETGEFGSVFDAAYSGSGSAASEIVASAIDNAMYGMSSKYSDDSPESLQGRTMPISDPEVMNKVRDRVVEGLKELAAMSVFAASKKGLQTAPSPEMAESEGTEIPRKDTFAQLGENVEKFSTGRFDDLMASGMPSSS